MFGSLSSSSSRGRRGILHLLQPEEVGWQWCWRCFQAPAAGGRFSFITVKRAGHEVRPSKTNPEPHPHRCTLTVKFDTPRLPQFRTT